MLYVIAIHFLVGLVTGCLFRVRTLLFLAVIVLMECAAVAIVLGAAAGLWSLAALVAIQAGYLGGIYVRSLFEKAGIAQPNADIGRLR